MLKVLHILNNLGSGGAETFVMNVYRNIDRTKVQFDFLIRSTENGSMIDEIKSMGGNVFILPPFPQKIFQNYKELKKFFVLHAHEYEAIHIHANSLIYVKPLKLAKKYNVHKIIIHSHSSSGRLKIVHKYNRQKVKKLANVFFACSSSAGDWMFPNAKYDVIPNGIDIGRFTFSPKDRNNIREKYNINDKFVVGNVGRFSKPKNHPFILDIFEKFHRINNNSLLMLVGDGENRSKIIKEVNDRGLGSDVIFVGAVTDVWRYFSAMDCFLFPSLWEGLGIVLIEAQVNGLPCLCSDVVPVEARIVNVSSRNLAENSQVWAETMRALNRNCCIDTADKLELYNIATIAYKLQEFYQSENIEFY